MSSTSGSLTDETRRDDPIEHSEALARELSTGPVDTIHVFGLRWYQALSAAYTWTCGERPI